MIADRPMRRGPGRRRGFGLIEMAISSLMLAAAMVATVQVIGWVAQEARAVARRERAVREAANLLEHASARPWDDLTDEALGRLKMTESTAAALPGSTLLAKVATVGSAPMRKVVTVEIRWNDRSGRPESPVRLVAWSHKAPGGIRP